MKPYTVSVTYEDKEFVVNYWPETQGRRYMANGDPGYPGDPAHIEIVSIDPDPADEVGPTSFLSDKQMEELAELVKERLEEETGEGLLHRHLAKLLFPPF